MVGEGRSGSRTRRALFLAQTEREHHRADRRVEAALGVTNLNDLSKPLRNLIRMASQPRSVSVFSAAPMSFWKCVLGPVYLISSKPAVSVDGFLPPRLSSRSDIAAHERTGAFNPATGMGMKAAAPSASRTDATAAPVMREVKSPCWLKTCNGQTR